MNVSQQLVRKPRLSGWYVEILMVGVALLIALLPSVLYFRTRARARASATQLGQLDPSARIYALQPLNGGTNIVTLPQSSQWMVFSLDLGNDSTSGRFRAAITRSDGQEVWQAQNLPASAGKLVFVLPSALLGPGDYAISVQPPQGVAPSADSRYNFHAAN